MVSTGNRIKGKFYFKIPQVLMSVLMLALNISAVQVTLQYLLTQVEIREVLFVFFHTQVCHLGMSKANIYSHMHSALASPPCSQCVGGGRLRRIILPIFCHKRPSSSCYTAQSTFILRITAQQLSWFSIYYRDMINSCYLP